MTFRDSADQGVVCKLPWEALYIWDTSSKALFSPCFSLGLVCVFTAGQLSPVGMLACSHALGTYLKSMQFIQGHKCVCVTDSFLLSCTDMKSISQAIQFHTIKPLNERLFYNIHFFYNIQNVIISQLQDMNLCRIAVVVIVHKTQLTYYEKPALLNTFTSSKRNGISQGKKTQHIIYEEAAWFTNRR